MNKLTPRVKAVEWRDNKCVLLDQTRLPQEEVYLTFHDYRKVARAIQALIVRGAPAIGIAGAYAVVLAAKESLALPEGQRGGFFKAAVEEIKNARPTAVNLRWAVAQMTSLLEQPESPAASELPRLVQKAQTIHAEDIAANQKMAAFGASLFTERAQVMTYCNTGDLATGGIGTALGVIRQGYLDGKVTHVFPCETRPVLQGLRLTVWELEKNEIPHTLICDNMAALTLQTGRVGAVIVGSDRIAANGDIANKVGTYGLAVLARHHNVPFYVAAPTSTFDLATPSGDEIPIEQRSGQEIWRVLGEYEPDPHGTGGVLNPSFDVTPHSLISAIICEKGVIQPVNARTIRAVLDKETAG